jgi:clan AA aspartic protease
MMSGRVERLHALLPIVFRLPDRPDITIEFVVDTGFTDQLTLPPEAVAAMALPLLTRIPADLADGSTVEISMHEATILWGETERQVRVLAAGRRPLLGTVLLDSLDLFAQFREGGLVIVKQPVIAGSGRLMPPFHLPEAVSTWLNKVFDSANVEDGRGWTQASIALRQGQPQFRRQILDAYRGRCAVTRNSAVAVLEAAYIYPYGGAETNHVTNGLLLRADIHSLFDQGLLTVDSDTMTVLVAPSIRSTVYGKLAGKPLNLPADLDHHPSKHALDLHRKEAGL